MLGILNVSDAYAVLHKGVDKLHSATSSARRVTESGIDFVQNPTL